MPKKSGTKYGKFCIGVGALQVATILPHLYEKLGEVVAVDDLIAGWELAHIIFGMLLEIALAGTLISSAFTGERCCALIWLFTITPYFFLGTVYAIAYSDQKRDETIIPSAAVIVAMWVAWGMVLLFYMANKPKDKRPRRTC